MGGPAAVPGEDIQRAGAAIAADDVQARAQQGLRHAQADGPQTDDRVCPLRHRMLLVSEKMSQRRGVRPWARAQDRPFAVSSAGIYSQPTTP